MHNVNPIGVAHEPVGQRIVRELPSPATIGLRWQVSIKEGDDNRPIAPERLCVVERGQHPRQGAIFIPYRVVSGLVDGEFVDRPFEMAADEPARFRCANLILNKLGHEPAVVSGGPFRIKCLCKARLFTKRWLTPSAPALCAGLAKTVILQKAILPITNHQPVSGRIIFKQTELVAWQGAHGQKAAEPAAWG